MTEAVARTDTVERRHDLGIRQRRARHVDRNRTGKILRRAVQPKGRVATRADRRAYGLRFKRVALRLDPSAVDVRIDVRHGVARHGQGAVRERYLKGFVRLAPQRSPARPLTITPPLYMDAPRFRRVPAQLARVRHGQHVIMQGDEVAEH